MLDFKDQNIAISSNIDDSSSDIILRVQELTKQFTLHEQDKVLPGLQPITFTVKSGKLTALTGPSGAGKSSLLKCVYRTYLPQTGEIYYCTAARIWIDLAKINEHEILHLRRSQISFVTQFLHFLPRQTTLDVVAKPLFDLGCNYSAEGYLNSFPDSTTDNYSLGVGRSDRTKARERAVELLRQIKLPEKLWKISPATFSGGEKQRVNLARAMILPPRLLLLDEPTASLDADSTQLVINLIKNIKQTGTGILAVFHDPNLIAALADDVVVVQPA